jgi:hypothetical protein
MLLFREVLPFKIGARTAPLWLWCPLSSSEKLLFISERAPVFLILKTVLRRQSLYVVGFGQFIKVVGLAVTGLLFISSRNGICEGMAGPSLEIHRAPPFQTRATLEPGAGWQEVRY